MLIDIHVHSAISPCSSLSLEDILARARALGLDGVCLTDHDTMAACSVVREGVQPDGLVVVVGMEYATSQGDFLLFGPFEDLAPGLSASEVLALVDAAGGAAVAAHPCRLARPTDREVVAKGLVHALEIVNGRNTAEENRMARHWPDRFGLTAVCGSDAHTLEELGRKPTRFLKSVSSRLDLIRALRRGQCFPEVRD